MTILNDYKLLAIGSIFVLVLIRKFFNYLFSLIINSNSTNEKHAFIVVLGDIGRSPRMNYHSLSLAKLGYTVSIIGYNGLNKIKEENKYKNKSILILNN
jgi:hypothetical protein